jgi:hypothetical protein
MSSEYNQYIDTYATKYPDIDASIIKDIIESSLSENDQQIYHEDVTDFLDQITNSINKTNKERQNEIEENFGSEYASEMKFSSIGKSQNEEVSQTKASNKQSSGLKKLFSFKSNSNSANKFQKFD